MTERPLNSDFFERRKSDFDENFKRVTENIERAAQLSGRTYEDIQLLAATKTVPTELINYALSKGIRLIGENRVQELMSKIDDIKLDRDSIHFIGHLQTNKVSMLLPKVSMIESVDSLHLAKEISKRSLSAGRVMNVLVEVNIGEEESKSGISPDAVNELVYQISELKGIKVKGLMTIPPVSANSDKTRQFFSDIYKLFVDIRDKRIDNIDMQCLSMGMSNDYAEAIAQGATIVRIGSALFGDRIYN